MSHVRDLKFKMSYIDGLLRGEAYALLPHVRGATYNDVQLIVMVCIHIHGNNLPQLLFDLSKQGDVSTSVKDLAKTFFRLSKDVYRSVKVKNVVLFI